MFKAGDIVRRKENSHFSVAWSVAVAQGVFTLVVDCPVERFGSQGFLAKHSIENVNPNAWWASANFELVRTKKLNLGDYL